MGLNLDAVGSEWDAGEAVWTARDSIIYALGVGAGATDPREELAFTTENSHGVAHLALPTFAVVAGRFSTGKVRGPELGDFPFHRVLHAEQAVTIHATVPVKARIRTTGRVEGMYDKGSGALVVLSERSVSADTGEPLFENRMALFVSGEGGFGGDRGPDTKVSFPDRPADHHITYPTRRDQALLYRLSGDRNPLHSDPWVAGRAGLEQPILHGLCTYGFAGRALLHTVCDSDPERFGSMTARFTTPVVPGEDLIVHLWSEGDRTLFRTTSGDTTVLDHGTFTRRT